MRHLDSEDVRGNSLTNATTRSLVAPSPPEPPVTTDPALTNVTGDNDEQRPPLIGQQQPILASDWLLGTHYRLGFIHKYQLCSGAWIRTEPTLIYPHLTSVFSEMHSAHHVCTLRQVLADHHHYHLNLLHSPTVELFYPTHHIGPVIGHNGHHHMRHTHRVTSSLFMNCNSTVITRHGSSESGDRLKCELCCH